MDAFLPGTNVTKGLFQSINYVQLMNGESEEEVFHHDMERQGWPFVDQRGSLYRYEREQEVLEIRSTQVKTMLKTS